MPAGENITIRKNSATAEVTVGGTATAAAATAVGTGQLTLDADKSYSVTAANTTDFFTATTAASQLQTVSALDVTHGRCCNRSLRARRLGTCLGQRPTREVRPRCRAASQATSPASSHVPRT